MVKDNRGLPIVRVRLEQDRVIGKESVNTQDKAVEYIIREMKKELGDPDCRVIATGGLGKVVANETDLIDEYDPDIAYKGLKILYEMNKAQ